MIITIMSGKASLHSADLPQRAALRKISSQINNVRTIDVDRRKVQRNKW